MFDFLSAQSDKTQKFKQQRLMEFNPNIKIFKRSNQKKCSNAVAKSDEIKCEYLENHAVWSDEIKYRYSRILEDEMK